MTDDDKKLFLPLTEDENKILIDALTGRIAYFNRFADNGPNTTRERQQAEKLRTRINRLALKY